MRWKAIIRAPVLNADFKKEALAQVFSCEFSEIFKNIFFYRTPVVTADFNGFLVKLDHV